ncbi:MAG: hypothetical protein ACRDTH_05675 [Pseudonocardiaceae bacterium]
MFADGGDRRNRPSAELLTRGARLDGHELDLIKPVLDERLNGLFG